MWSLTPGYITGVQKNFRRVFFAIRIASVVKRYNLVPEKIGRKTGKPNALAPCSWSFSFDLCLAKAEESDHLMGLIARADTLLTFGV